MTKTLPALVMALTLVAQSVFADNVDRVVTPFTPTTNLMAARINLGRYLSNGGGDQPRKVLESMQLSGESAISMALDSVLEVINDKDSATQMRVDWAMKLILRMALRTSQERSELSAGGRSEISFKLGRLLREFRHNPVSTQKISEIYDFLGLWGRNELWFVGPKARTLEGLITYFTPLMTMVPELSEDEMRFLEKHIRAIKPQQVVPYMALYQMNLATERDFTTFFRLLSERFGDAFYSIALSERVGPNLNYSAPKTYRDYEDSRMMSFYNEALRHLQIALDRQDPVITAAFEKAKQNAMRSEIQDGKRQFRALFFGMFEAGTPDLLKTETIRTMAEGSLQNGEYILPVPEKQVVTKVDFSGNRPSAQVISLDSFRKARTSCNVLHLKKR